MSHTYTDGTTYAASITLPDDGDAGGVLSVNTAFQGLADRTNVLYQTLTATGIKRAQYFASAAALRGQTASIGDFAVVSGLGVYNFVSLIGTQTDNGVTLITPTGGGGYWVAVGLGRSALGAANGVPQLDSGGQQSAASQHGARLEATTITYGSVANIPGTNSYSAFGVSGTSPSTGVAGDTFAISGGLSAYCSSGATFSVALYANGVAIPGAACTVGYSSGTPNFYTIAADYTATSNGSVVFQLYQSGGSSYQLQLNSIAVTARRFSALCLF